MPITHSRILALAAEAREVESRMESLRDHIRQTIGFIVKGDMTGTYEVAGALEAALLAHPVPRMDATLAEEQHFAKNFRRNARAAQRSAVQRRAAGIPPDPAKAPQSILRNPLPPHGTQPAPAAHRPHLEPSPIDWTPPKDFVYPYAADIERTLREAAQESAPPAPAAHRPHIAQPETSTPEEAEEWVRGFTSEP